MAKKTRYRYRTKKIYRRARSGGGGMKPIIDGLLAGAGAGIIKNFVNVPFADDLALLGVGYFRKNNTLKVLGGIGLAGDLLNFSGIGNKSNMGYI